MAFLAAVSGSFLTYSLPSEFMKQHPNQYLLYSYILSILPFIFPAFAIASCVLAIYQGLMQKSLSIVEQEASNLRGQIDLLADNVRSLFEGFLYRFSTKLQFASRDENTERVTLYIFNETNKNFVPCGRYAANPMFKANGRPSYPSTEGCIARGWQHGWHFDNSFDANSNSRTEKHAKEYNVSRAVSRKLKMPSRLYAVLGINGVSGNPVAVMVVESTDPNRWDEALLKAVMKEQEEYLAELVMRLKEYIPDPSGASEKGL
jgi:hypothetical protein